MVGGDRLFICNGIDLQLDIDHAVDVTVSGSIFRYVYPEGDIIIVSDRRLVYLRRGALCLVADTANASRFLCFEIA
jgi:hypothetical protein